MDSLGSQGTILHTCHKSHFLMVLIMFFLSMTDSGLIGSGDYWTGGREMNIRGNWRWSDNSEIKFKDWGSGEPDEDTDIINMNCLMIRLSGWKDRHCTGTKKFICEKDFP